MLAPHWTVETAVDGEAALTSIRARRPDVVLTDVMMPNLDGFGLVARLRANEATADLPVIVLSARAGEESRIEGLQVGADDYLVKPFSARELIARVQVHVSLAQLRRRLLDRAEEARRAAEDATRAKDEFLAMLGHELRNPLSPIVIAVELMRLRGVNVEGAVGHRAPGQAAHAAGRRPARRIEDHAREGRPPQGAHVDRRGRQARRRDHAAAVSGEAAAARAGRPRRSLRRWRPHAAAAGVREPADERLEVQRSGHARRRLCERPWEIASRSAFATTGSASARR